MGYSIAIIGAGPGGVILARELAKKDLDVTIYEKGNFSDLGHDWSDAVERVALQAVGIELPVIAENRWVGPLVKKNVSDKGLFEPHAFPMLKVVSPGYRCMKTIDFAMIATDRRNLGKLLVVQALEAGANIKYGHEGTCLLYREKGADNPGGVEVYGVRVKDLSTGEEKDITADIVVESSGFSAVLRKSLPHYTGLADPFRDSEFALVHREVRERNKELAEKDRFPDHYRYGYFTGYQWSHVHDDNRIDVGAGVRFDPINPDPRDLIEEFISRHRSITSNRIRGGRSLCIVGRPLLNFVTNGFFVLGDAAATSVPTTGCGAGSAMLMGLWAAEVIAEAAEEKRNDINKLWDINTKFYLESSRGGNFAALTGLRFILQSLTHDDVDFLFRRNIMDTATLQDAVNGIFTPSPLLTKVKSLLKGITRPDILSLLNLATSTGANIKKHYQDYPEKWDTKKFYQWQTETDKLFRKVNRQQAP